MGIDSTTSSTKTHRGARMLLSFAQGTVLAVFSIMILASVLLTGLSLGGVLPWLQLDVSFGGQAVPYAGMAVQILFTLLLVSLLVFLPSNARVLRLERTHRDFRVNLNDIAEAYSIAHASDRSGVFALSEEFETVRERLHHLRNHPDLGNLEPEILEIAAKMSFVSRDLATVYSDENVARARAFLTQRQEEIARYANYLNAARRTCAELKRWTEDVKAEERQVKRQVARLDADLQEILPKLGYAFETVDAEAKNTVVPLPKKSANDAATNG